MRIITWNCQGAFRRKAEPIARFRPDIAVIQECECPERWRFPAHVPQPTTCLWFGERATKGIGILSYTDLSFALHPPYDPDIRYCIPLRVMGPKLDLHMLAVWAMNHPDPKLSYVGQIAQAVTRYREFISAKETLIVGDFNSNKQWDRKPRIGNHSWLVDTLRQYGLVSTYHQWSGEAQGEETAKTFYMYRKQEKVYHIDYCFIPHSWLERLTAVVVGDHQQWLSMSDHMPLLLELAND